MNVASLKSRLKGEHAAVACIVLGAVGVYLLIIQPSLVLVAAREEARAARSEIARKLVETRSENHALHAAIALQKQQLADLGGSPPSLLDKESQFAEVAGLARACGLIIDQYSPSGSVDTAEYSVAYAQFSARGPYQRVHEFFRRIEAELDYLDVTHFSLTSIAGGEPGDEPFCLVSWSCKLSGMPRSGAPAVASRHPRALEVAYK